MSVTRNLRLFQRYSLILLVTALVAGCATVGRDFPSDRVSRIKIGQTTQSQIKALFGKPWRTGIEDGYRTWTYGHYHYSVFGQPSTKDLVVRFDRNHVVKSYSFNTTAHQNP